MKKKSISIKTLIVGVLDTNCYLIVDENSAYAVVIDPGFNKSEFKDLTTEISPKGLKVKYIINTHGHVDHISGNDILKKTTGAQIMIHSGDALMLKDPQKNFSNTLGLKIVSPPADVILQDGDIIKVGSIELKVLHTPGHSKGSISLYFKNEDILFSGDTLFAGSIGRTDLPGSSFKEITRSLKEILIKIPNQTIVYPGHGKSTTIEKEKKNQYYTFS
jgi:glyoxylase-like metal-dependent hydrolase (beta-lactamase superfamily II)